MPRITISKVHPDDKRKYQKWCIDHAEGSLSSMLRWFVQWLGDEQPTWDEVVKRLTAERGK